MWYIFDDDYCDQKQHVANTLQDVPLKLVLYLFFSLFFILKGF